MGRDHIEDQTLLELMGAAQREALACRWPLILVEATRRAELAEAIRQDLTEEPA